MASQTLASSVQEMAWCMFGTKLLPEPIMTSVLLDPWEYTEVKFWSKLIKKIIPENADENAACKMETQYSNQWWCYCQLDFGNGLRGNFVQNLHFHYDDVIMTTLASQLTSLTVVYSIVYSGVNQENIKAPRHWPLCGEVTGTGEFPAQRTSNAEKVSIWWRHHVHLRECIWKCHLRSGGQGVMS